MTVLLAVMHSKRKFGIVLIKIQIFNIIELSDPNPKAVYLEMVENMDEMAYWTYFIFTRLTFPIFVLSNLLLTAVNYFVLDMGSESYFLPSPILYVQCSMIVVTAKQATILIGYLKVKPME